MNCEWICATCGVQFPLSLDPPAECPICQDERQYVGFQGQRWLTPAAFAEGRRNTFEEKEPGVWAIHTEPSFAIGQHAYFIETAEGNILWDCVTLLDEATIRRVNDLGGIRHIVVSHPHYYSAMAAWSEAFQAQLWIHAHDREWVVNAPSRISYWAGEDLPLSGGFTVHRSGGHFRGYQVGVWNGALFAGDQPQVCMDRRWVSFLYSYPNMIPFSAATVRRLGDHLAALEFNRIYGAFGRNVPADAKGVVARSVDRYLRALETDRD